MFICIPTCICMQGLVEDIHMNSIHLVELMFYIPTDT